MVLDMQRLPLAISLPIGLALLVVVLAVMKRNHMANVSDKVSDSLQDAYDGLNLFLLVLLCVLLVLQSVMFMSAMGMISGWQVSSDVAWNLSYALWIVALFMLAMWLAGCIRRSACPKVTLDGQPSMKLTLLYVGLILVGLYQGAVGLDLAGLMSYDVQRGLAIGGTVVAGIFLLGALGVLGYRVGVQKPIRLKLYTVL